MRTCLDEEAFFFLLNFAELFMMGYLGFYYVEAKAFEIQSEEGLEAFVLPSGAEELTEW
jgi:hypothetical protein